MNEKLTKLQASLVVPTYHPATGTPDWSDKLLSFAGLTTYIKSK
jgi:hypothetical protein